jgi:hypothetical protein
MSYQTYYYGEKPTTNELKDLEVKKEMLYGIDYIQGTPTEFNVNQETHALGENLDSTLQRIDSRGNVRIYGPIKIVGENQ